MILWVDFIHCNASRTTANVGAWILSMGQRSITLERIWTKIASHLNVVTKVTVIIVFCMLPVCSGCNLYHYTICLVVYKKCHASFRNIQYKVDHDQFGVDPSSCKRCMCENGKFNMSTCDDSHNCTLLTPNSKNSCNMEGKQYHHQQVFTVDKCNKCKCFNGKVSGCTRRKCMGDDNDTPCDKCKKSHRKPVCGPNGVTYDNICAAKNCAEFDPLEVILVLAPSR